MNSLSQWHLGIIKDRQVGLGSVRASDSDEHGFRWRRDDNKAGRLFARLGMIPQVRQIARQGLNDLLEDEHKIAWIKREGPPCTPENEYKYYIHPKRKLNGQAIDGHWPFNQPEALGEFLHLVLTWQSWGWGVIQTADDWRALWRLPEYFDVLQVHDRCTNGVWEQENDIYLSTLLPVAAGLISAKQSWFPTVSDDSLWHLMNRISQQVPHECSTRSADLALLMVIAEYGDQDWFLELVPLRTQYVMVECAEDELVGSRGVNRNWKDWYHRCCEQPQQWTIGDQYLAMIWERWGKYDRALYYFKRCMRATLQGSGCIPESWCGNEYHLGDGSYHNAPLVWAHSLMAQNSSLSLIN